MSLERETCEGRRRHIDKLSEKEKQEFILSNDIHDLSLQNFIENRYEVYHINVKYIDLDKRLHSWVLEQKVLGDTISNVMLKNKTMKLMAEFGGPAQGTARICWLNEFKERYGIITPEDQYINMYELSQILARKEEEVNQCGTEQFIQEFILLLEKKNISTNNIYVTIKTNIIWESLVQYLLKHIDKRKIAQERINIKDVENSETFMFIFCTNVTDNQNLVSFSLETEYEKQIVLERCENRRLLVARNSQENASPEESKDFVFWYNIFQIFLRKKNVMGKILLLIDNCMRYVLTEENQQNDYFEVLLVPAHAVSSFEPLYSEIIEKIKEKHPHFHM